MLKKLILMLTASFLCIASYAQKNKFFVKGGANIANITITDNGHDDDAHAMTRFHAGYMADFPLSKYFSFQPGLLFTGKGTEIQQGQPSDALYWKTTTKLNYIEMPVNLIGKIPLTNQNYTLFIGAGPYVAIGVSGKTKLIAKQFDMDFEEKIDVDFRTKIRIENVNYRGPGFYVLKPFDFGFNGMAGFELKNLLLSVNYGYGLSNLKYYSIPGIATGKHRVLSFSAGFKL